VLDNLETGEWIMNFKIFLLAAVATLLGEAAMAQSPLTAATTTATPVLSGTYIVRVTHLCQVVLSTTTNGSAGGSSIVTVTNSGDANQNIGTITFNHASGKATLSADSIDGSPLLVIADGNQLGLSLGDTPPGNPPPSFDYSNTSTSFTVTIGGKPVTYHAFYANINSSTKVPQFIIFGGIEKPGCTTTGIAIHQ
jgi:hypothetical protein